MLCESRHANRGRRTPFSGFAPGTKPAEFFTERQLLEIKEALILSVDQLEYDYAAGLFGNYIPAAMIAKVYGFEVDTIDDVLEYVLHHDGEHAGIIRALKTGLRLNTNRLSNVSMASCGF